MSWIEGPMRGLDFESTGVNPTEDRPITCGIVDVHPDRRPFKIQWLIDPGVDVTPEATDVHGWTRDRIVDLVGGEGQALRVSDGDRRQIPAEAAVHEIAMLVAQAMGLGTPVVAFNAAYDLTMLEASCRRYGIDTLAARPAGVVGVVDPMVLDKAFDPYRKACYKAPGCDQEAGTHACGGCRKGKVECGGCGVTDRKLTSLYRHYHQGRELAGDAHSAADDALAGVRVAQRVGAAWPQIARWKLGTLHQHQVTWRREQCASLREFFDKVGKSHDGIPGEWPVLPAAYGVERVAGVAS